MLVNLTRRYCCLLIVSSVVVVHGIVRAQTANPQPAASAAGLSRVSGTVVSRIDGHPLGQTTISLRDAKNPQKFESVVTEDDGKFAFGDVPTGKYSLTGVKRGYIAASYDQHDQFSTAIVTGAGLKTEGLQLKLTPNAVIWGRVLDESGEPVRHGNVILYYDDHSEGVDQIRQRNGAQTDDLGAFELINLVPGTYFLAAQATPWYALHPPSDSFGKEESAFARSLDVAYPQTYYADVTDTDSATPIPIKGGERLQVDIHLNPVPALRLLFHVPGDQQHGFAFPRLEQPAFDGSAFVQVAGQSTTPGIIEMTGIPAGRYNVRLQGRGADVQMNGVDLTKDGEQIDVATAEPLADVKISVQTLGGKSIPKGLSVGLRSNGRSMAGLRAVDEKGQSEITDVPAGRYDVVLWGAAKPYSISKMTLEGAEVSGHSIALSAGVSASVSLTVVAGNVQVNGIAKKAGKGFAGAMIVLVPKNPAGNRDLFRRDQSDLDGTFTLRNVVPGSYSLLAIENGWDLDWSQPAVIAVYARHGQPVEVGDMGTLDLTNATPVVSK
jgi:hypothetical protein